MSVADSKNFGVENWEIVSVDVMGERWVIFKNVVVRAGDNYALDMHLDMDEANGAGLWAGAWGEIVKVKNL